MRINLSTTREVAQVWAAQSQPQGKASNLFFEGTSLYSYGKHFCVARILSTGVALIATKAVSQSTNEHIRFAREEAGEKHKVVRCFSPDARVWVNRGEAIERIHEAFEDADLPRIRQKRRDASNALALTKAQAFDAYLAVLPEEERGDVQPFSCKTVKQLREYFIVKQVIERLS